MLSHNLPKRNLNITILYWFCYKSPRSQSAKEEFKPLYLFVLLPPVSSHNLPKRNLNSISFINSAVYLPRSQSAKEEFKLCFRIYNKKFFIMSQSAKEEFKQKDEKSVLLMYLRHNLPKRNLNRYDIWKW